jgi:hypothetical protein
MPALVGGKRHWLAEANKRRRFVGKGSTGVSEACELRGHRRYGPGRDGRVELLELEPTSHNPEQTDGGRFPVKSLPASSFELCGDCAKTHIIARWRTTGPVLMLRTQSMEVKRLSRRKNSSAALAV